MHELWLFVHMVGLSIGAGTGVYLAAVARFAEKNLSPTEGKAIMPGIGGAISAVGKTGMVLLLLSGLVMANDIGLSALTTLFWVKMALVIAVLSYVALMEWMAKKLTISGDQRTAERKKFLGFFGPPLGLATILAAVLAFN